MRSLLLRPVAAAVALCLAPLALALTSPKEHFGFTIDDYQLATYTQTEAYFKKLAGESDRLKLVDIGPTEEGRRQYMVICTSPANLAKLDHYRDIAQRLARAEGVTEDQARALKRDRELLDLVFLLGFLARDRHLQGLDPGRDPQPDPLPGADRVGQEGHPGQLLEGVDDHPADAVAQPALELGDRLVVAVEDRPLGREAGPLGHRELATGADVTKLLRHLGWKPTTGMDEGLAKQIEWQKGFC